MQPVETGFLEVTIASGQRATHFNQSEFPTSICAG
jgi:hypothetical protein